MDVPLELFEETSRTLQRLDEVKSRFRRGLSKATPPRIEAVSGVHELVVRQPSEFGTVPSDWEVMPIERSRVKSRSAARESQSCIHARNTMVLSRRSNTGKSLSRNLGAYKRLG